jgi:hypothetical protein
MTIAANGVCENPADFRLMQGVHCNGADKDKDVHQKACTNTDLHDLLVDIKGIVIIGVFTVLAPVLAFGWIALPFRYIAVYMLLYLVTQNCPNFFCVRRFESWLGSHIFREFGQVRPEPSMQVCHWTKPKSTIKS